MPQLAVQAQWSWRAKCLFGCHTLAFVDFAIEDDPFMLVSTKGIASVGSACIVILVKEGLLFASHPDVGLKLNPSR